MFQLNPEPTVAYVRWRDACYNTDEIPHEALGGLVELHEFGFVIADSEEAITICPEYQDGATSSRLTITVPRCNIVEMRTWPLSVLLATKKARKKT